MQYAPVRAGGAEARVYVRLQRPQLGAGQRQWEDGGYGRVSAEGFDRGPTQNR